MIEYYAASHQYFPLSSIEDPFFHGKPFNEVCHESSAPFMIDYRDRSLFNTLALLKPAHPNGAMSREAYVVCALLLSCSPSRVSTAGSSFRAWQRWLISQGGDYTPGTKSLFTISWTSGEKAMMHLIMKSILNEELLAYKQQWSPLSHADDDGPVSTGNW